jgi:hypothetical protein
MYRTVSSRVSRARWMRCERWSLRVRRKPSNMIRDGSRGDKEDESKDLNDQPVEAS